MLRILRRGDWGKSFQRRAGPRPTTFPPVPIMKPIPRFPADSRRRGLSKIMAGGLLPASLLLVLAVSCFSDSGPAPVPPTGPVTEEFMRQRHAFMLDTVLERPKRMGRFLREQERLETERNLTSFDQVLSEQQRILAELREIQERGGVEFGRLLSRQEQLSRSLRRQRGFASPHDRAVFSRVLAEQRRILAELNKTVAVSQVNFREIRARQRRLEAERSRIKGADVEDFNKIRGRQRSFDEEQAEKRRLAREKAVSVILLALLEQEQILLEMEGRRRRNDELFFEIQGEARRHREKLERERLEFEARFLERFRQQSDTQSTSSSPPLSGF